MKGKSLASETEDQGGYDFIRETFGARVFTI